MTFMTIFAIMAVGLNIVVGFAGLLDLGYVAFYAIGAYVAAFLASPHWAGIGINLTFLGNVGPGAQGVHIPFWIVVPIAVIVVATFGALLGAPTLRLRGDYLAIVTLGFGEIVPLVFKNLSSITVSFSLGPIVVAAQQRQPDGRRAGRQPDRPAIPAVLQYPLRLVVRAACCLSRDLHAGHRRPRGPQSPVLAHRPSLDGHPRG